MCLGGLVPHFRVLFSPIFHGASLGNFHQGRNPWKVAEVKVWSFLVILRTFFICVFKHFRAVKIPGKRFFDPEHGYLRRVRARVALGWVNAGMPLARSTHSAALGSPNSRTDTACIHSMHNLFMDK